MLASTSTRLCFIRQVASNPANKLAYAPRRAFSLTVDKAQQLQRIGASPDLGLCSGTKKVSGEGRELGG